VARRKGTSVPPSFGARPKIPKNQRKGKKENFGGFKTPSPCLHNRSHDRVRRPARLRGTETAKAASSKTPVQRSQTHKSAIDKSRSGMQKEKEGRGCRSEAREAFNCRHFTCSVTGGGGKWALWKGRIGTDGGTTGVDHEKKKIPHYLGQNATTSGGGQNRSPSYNKSPGLQREH